MSATTSRTPLAALMCAFTMSLPGAAQTAPAPSPVPSDAEIRRILEERGDKYRQTVGIVVGVIELGGRRIVTYGRRAKGDAAPLDGDTVFEIGSITKVFTSLLLADMAGRGEVALDDPVARYLPPEVKMPQRGGRAITLADLATHRSGLPRLPDNLQPKDLSNPYADYRTWLGYEPRSRTGVVVMTNARSAAGPDDIGRHLLVPASPLLTAFPSQAPVAPRVETKIEPAIFDRYVGRYQLAPSAIITISRDGGRFLAQLTGQPAVEIFAEGEKDFFLKVVDAQLTFEAGATGPATAVVLHQNGQNPRAPRIGK